MPICQKYLRETPFAIPDRMVMIKQRIHIRWIAFPGNSMTAVFLQGGYK